MLKAPYPPLLLRVLRSSMLAWLLVAVTFVLVMAGAALSDLIFREEAIELALYPVWPTRLLSVVLAAGLLHLDRTRAHEHLLQADFGVSVVWFRATALGAARASDLTVQALLPAAGPGAPDAAAGNDQFRREFLGPALGWCGIACALSWRHAIRRP